MIECHGNAAAIVARLEEQSGYDVSVLGSTVAASTAPQTAHLLALPGSAGA